MEAYGGFEPEVGEIRALRSFRVGPGGVLYPLFGDRAWLPGENVAVCKVLAALGPEVAADVSHAAPDPDCTCGFYAYADELSAEEFPHARHVLGVVSCWGHVIAGTRGVRAQYARIEAIWMSPRVPESLQDAVARRYRDVTVFDTKQAMLAANPLTELDCYERPRAPERTLRRRVVQAALAAAAVIGSLPADWIWHHPDARLIWAVDLAFVVLIALFHQLTGKDRQLRGVPLFYAAVALWLVAPFAGNAGIFLLRMPILQIAFLGLLHRARLTREAGRFPAAISLTRS